MYSEGGGVMEKIRLVKNNPTPEDLQNCFTAVELHWAISMNFFNAKESTRIVIYMMKDWKKGPTEMVTHFTDNGYYPMRWRE